MNIKGNDSHSRLLPRFSNHGSRRATRQLRIRARSATGQVEGGGQITTRARSSSDTSACPPCVLPTPQIPVHGSYSIHPWQKMRIGASRLFMPDNNRIEQDHRRIKRRIRSMLGFKSTASAETILSGIELIHMMRKNRRGMPTIQRHHSQNSSTASWSDQKL